MGARTNAADPPRIPPDPPSGPAEPPRDSLPVDPPSGPPEPPRDPADDVPFEAIPAAPAGATMERVTAPQAPNGSVLASEASPSGATVMSLDIGGGVSAPQAPGPQAPADAP